MSFVFPFIETSVAYTLITCVFMLLRGGTGDSNRCTYQDSSFPTPPSPHICFNECITKVSSVGPILTLPRPPARLNISNTDKITDDNRTIFSGEVRHCYQLNTLNLTLWTWNCKPVSLYPMLLFFTLICFSCSILPYPNYYYLTSPYSRLLCYIVSMLPFTAPALSFLVLPYRKIHCPTFLIDLFPAIPRVSRTHVHSTIIILPCYHMSLPCLPFFSTLPSCSLPWYTASLFPLYLIP